MLTFANWLVEYRLNDIRYFQSLADTTPPQDVAAAQARFGLADRIQWKSLTNKSFTHSRELDGDVIAMRQGDERENWFHELGHSVYSNADHAHVDPLLDRIAAAYGTRDHHGVKWLSLGDYEYTYSHSGPEYERDELFAITFAYVVSGEGELEDSALQADYHEMLARLERAKSGVKPNKDRVVA
jgi:hypothetical protein